MEAVEEKKLSEWMKSNPVKWASKSSVCVVLASEGYPGSYVKGKEISGLDEAEGLVDSYVFHRGHNKER